MGELVYTGLTPHPPIVVPEVGRQETAKVALTRQGLQRWADEVVAQRPDLVLLITPHGAVFRDALAVTVKETLQGDLAQFAAAQVALTWAGALPEARLLVARGREAGLPFLALDEAAAKRWGCSLDLDHGCLVPLYYLHQAGLACPLVVMAAGLLPLLDLYHAGMVIAGAVAEDFSGRVAVLASGDLSHRLHPGAPAGYHPLGQEFDRLLKEALQVFDVKRVLALPPDLIEAAGECGLRPLVMVLGTLEGRLVQPRIFSYEGPFGVGYLVAGFEPGQREQGRELWSSLLQERRRQPDAGRQQESLPVRLARASLEHYVKYGRVLAQLPSDLPSYLTVPAAAFVSLKKDGQLRGCIGTVSPTQPSVAAEISQNAISAGTGDPRFDPVREDELPYLTYSVDILSAPEEISSLAELDPRRYGVIVSGRGRRGLLLPDLEGIDTAEEQVEVARRKAGLDPQEPVLLERFEVVRYS